MECKLIGQPSDNYWRPYGNVAKELQIGQRSLNADKNLMNTPVIIGLERCNTLNPATLMPLPTDGEKDEHDCEQVIKMTSKPRDDLRDQPLDNPDMNLFTDGSSYYEEGWKCTGFAVTTETKVLLAGPLPPTLGAQGAEIVALTKAAQYAIGIRVNSYTDSKYAFGVCHATGMLWKERGFLTSAGKMIAHGQQIKELLEAIQLPSELAVIYIKAHTNQENQLAKGNELADQAAKAAARQVIFAMTLTHQEELDLELPDMQKLYEELPEEERRLWEKLGAEQQNGQWTLGGKPLLPKRYLIPIVRWHHEKTHGGPENTALRVQRLWAAPGIYTAIKRVCEGCRLCKEYASLKIKAPAGKRPPATYPFQKLQIDYAEMPRAMGYVYLLVIIDQLSGWVEAFPTRKNDSKAVVKALLKEIIPRGKPIWADPSLWQDIAAQLEKLVVKVHHIDAHVPKSRATEEHQNNQQVDQAAKIEVAQVDLDWQRKGELFIPRCSHDTPGHQGRESTYRWTRDRGVDLTMDAISQVIHECETCTAIKQAKRVKPLWYGG
ncbi:hypothetical protein GRJ2_003442600 [Grus japonensis]|uniref:Uncharacterized protein n=1 Tax=Grus japonensis TaxID=30415 RepID=A0ABC9YJW7_GRUJA